MKDTVIKNRKRKYPVESTTPGYPELELALFKAHEKIGWKALTAFLCTWTSKHQPDDTNYSLPWWVKETNQNNGVWNELKKDRHDSAAIVKLIKKR